MIFPLLVMVVLTFAVAAFLLFTRVNAVRSGAVKFSYFRLMQGEAPDNVLAASRHFENLFQMPVLFYAAAVLAIAGNLQSNFLIGLAWIFVIARAVHTVIHLTSNNINQRLTAFLVSNAALLVMWLVIGWHFF